MRKYVVEFIGTMFLVLAIGLNITNPMGPVVIGLTLACMIYIGGHVSGAHYNPAISIAVWLRGKLELKDVPLYIVAQVLGAFVGASLCYYLRAETFVLNIGLGITHAQAILVETLFTFAMALVILTVATTKKFENNYVYGFVIGLTVTAIIYCGRSISGAAYNPAIGIGTFIMDTITGGKDGFSALYIYLVGPFAGGVLSALFYRFVNPEE